MKNRQTRIFYKMVITDNIVDIFSPVHVLHNNCDNRTQKMITDDNKIEFSRGLSESYRRALLVYKTLVVIHFYDALSLSKKIE